MQWFAKIISVAARGALGAVLRYIINVSPLAALSENFPFPTFFINVFGSFLIGFLFVLLTDKCAVNENFRLAVLVGFIGAFTTFSTFEMEIFEFADKRYFAAAFLYLFLSILIGFIGVAGGIWMAKRF